MSCSPLLDGITDPVGILQVVSEHPVLQWSEPSTTFLPLAERSWMEYKRGAWVITETGQKALRDETPKAIPLTDFFGI